MQLTPRAGTVASGILGGLISSTATTVSYARRSKQAPDTQALATIVIMTASAIVFARVLVLIGATAPVFLQTAGPPICVMLGVMALLALRSWFTSRGISSAMPEQENPSELKPAIFFAVLYGLVLLAVAAAKNYFGDRGLYAVAILSGLTDMDAITLSVTQLVNSQKLPAETGWRLILVASMSNLAFKTATVVAIGDRKLAARIMLLFGLAIGGGAVILAFWPR